MVQTARTAEWRRKGTNVNEIMPQQGARLHLFFNEIGRPGCILRRSTGRLPSNG